MFMMVVAAVFSFIALRGFPWKMLVFAIPFATIAGLIDTPPDFSYLRIFARDFMTVLTKAIFVSTASFAFAKVLGSAFRRYATRAP